jgi:hypothetical protein
MTPSQAVTSQRRNWIANHDSAMVEKLLIFTRRLQTFVGEKMQGLRRGWWISWCLSFCDRSRRPSKDGIEDSEPAGVTDVDAVKNARRQEPI